MDNFKAIYEILSFLEKAMDCKEFAREVFTAQFFGLSEERFKHLLKMLADRKLVEGLHVSVLLSGGLVVNWEHPRITLYGLQYLRQEAAMQEERKKAKGIRA